MSAAPHSPLETNIYQFGLGQADRSDKHKKKTQTLTYKEHNNIRLKGVCACDISRMMVFRGFPTRKTQPWCPVVSVRRRRTCSVKHMTTPRPAVHHHGNHGSPSPSSSPHCTLLILRSTCPVSFLFTWPPEQKMRERQAQVSRMPLYHAKQLLNTRWPEWE